VTLAGVQPGDIVRAGESHAIVLEKERGRLLVLWIGSNSSRWVKAGEIEAHWRRRR
jgi:hypothetical protein